MSQTHLNKDTMINLGAFYTPKFVVELAYKMLEKRVNLEDFLIFDNACGYGDFFVRECEFLGADIDSEALKKVPKSIKTIHTNSLQSVSRTKFGIKQDKKLIIVGNPPYNDTTSLVKSGVKKHIFAVDEVLKCRDLGISFLRSYALLEPEFICVLHPLSYLVKRTNFNALAKFRQNYRLIDDLIISSEIFSPHSNSFFPIIIAMYEKNALGMDFDFIKNYSFKSYEGQKFSLNDFDFISNYICKYPNPHDTRQEVAFFHTLRDINALKRNKTFLAKNSSFAVRVFAENFKYYCYIHHFKHFAHKLPYFLGNFDIFIDNDAFLKHEKDFLNLEPNSAVNAYFERLFKDFV